MNNALKVQIIRNALQLLEQLSYCEDDDFIDVVANSIYENDAAPLWTLEDQLYNDWQICKVCYNNNTKLMFGGVIMVHFTVYSIGILSGYLAAMVVIRKDK